MRHDRIVERFKWLATAMARGGRARSRVRVDSRGYVQMLERDGAGRQAWRTINLATLRALASRGRLDPYRDLLPGLSGAIEAALTGTGAQGDAP